MIYMLMSFLDLLWKIITIISSIAFWMLRNVWLIIGLDWRYVIEACYPNAEWANTAINFLTGVNFVILTFIYWRVRKRKRQKGVADS